MSAVKPGGTFSPIGLSCLGGPDCGAEAHLQIVMTAPNPSPAPDGPVAATQQAAMSPRGRRAALWMAGLLVVFGIVLVLAVPPILRPSIESLASEALGRPVQLTALRWHPWSLTFDLEGLRVGGVRADEPPLVELANAQVDLAWRSVWTGSLVVDELVLQSPVLRLHHLGGGRWNVIDLLSHHAKPDASAGPPPRFELRDLRVVGGRVEVRDDSTASVHLVENIELVLPFVSSHDAHRDEPLTPRLAFRLNGSDFDTQAHATPFAATARTLARIEAKDIDLSAYAAYVPQELGLLPRKGRLDLSVELRHAQPRAAVPPVSASQVPPSVAAPATMGSALQTELKLGGRLELRQFELTDTQGAEVVVSERVLVDMSGIDWARRTVDLSELRVSGVRAGLRRGSNGDWVLLNDAPVNRSKTIATDQDVALARAKNEPESSPQAPAAAPWRVQVGELQIARSRIDWVDETTLPPGRVRLQDIDLAVRQGAWPTAADATSSFKLSSGVLMGERPGRLLAEGQWSTRQVNADVELQGIALQGLAPWVKTQTPLDVSGDLSLKGQVDWDLAADPSSNARRRLLVNSATVSKLTAVHEGTKYLEVPRLQLEALDVQLPERTVRVGTLVVNEPRARVVRDAEGQWMVQSWAAPGNPAPVKTASAGEGPSDVASASPEATSSASAAPTAGQAALAATPAPWQAQIKRFEVTAGQLSLLDLQPRRPVGLDVDQVALTVDEFTWPSPLAKQIRVSARVGAGAQQAAGDLLIDGPFDAGTGQATLRVKAQGIPLHDLVPYLPDRLALEVVRAEGRFDGEVQWRRQGEADAIAIRGTAGLDELRASRGGTGLGITEFGDDLLRWRSLAVVDLDLDWQGGQTRHVRVRETVLDDFYARVVVQEDGRVNVQDWWRESDSPQAAASSTSGPAQPAAPVQIQVGPTSLLRGRVQFADRFIKPNYKADLSELTGRVSGFSSSGSASEREANVQLRGRAEGTAFLEIDGKVDPVSPQLSFDIKGRMRDLELSPLSPYAVKYAGHGIERGKLSATLEYVLAPDGQLSANNKLVLQQLVFGEPVAGAPGSLPVRLAVALLADRNGVIDIDLPISGSLSDPQFSIGALLWRVAGNLIVKAVSAPFALLAKAFSGGERSQGMIDFAPGSARLDAQAKVHVETLAQSLLDKPGLRLTISGTAVPEQERDAWQRERLRLLAHAELQRPAAVAASTPATRLAMLPGAAPTVAGMPGGAGPAAALPPAGQAPADVDAMSDQQYQMGLRRVYQRAEIPKPRTPSGQLKELSLGEIETLLLTHMPVGDETMRELALARSVVVRDAMLGRGIETARLYLGAVKLASGVAGASEPAPAQPIKPGVELSIGTD